MPDQTRGCVLFADVSGSTKLYEIVGDTKAHEAIERCVRLFSSITVDNGGRVVKTIGDEVMSIFSEPSQAAAAAKAIQSGVESMAPVDRVRLGGVRIGFHEGPLVERDGDVFGDTVNLTARGSTEMAARGQIITSLETVEPPRGTPQDGLPPPLFRTREGPREGGGHLRAHVDGHRRCDADDGASAAAR